MISFIKDKVHNLTHNEIPIMSKSKKAIKDLERNFHFENSLG